jgi:cytochrome c553
MEFRQTDARISQRARGHVDRRQVTVLAQGIVKQWGNPSLLAGQNPRPIWPLCRAMPSMDLQAYGVFCARCHGAIGEGGPADGNAKLHKGKLGSIVDPSYLAIISDQNLRSITIAGRPDEANAGLAHDAARPMTDQQVTDILAWLASKRVANPGQPYPNASLNSMQSEPMLSERNHRMEQDAMNPSEPQSPSDQGNATSPRRMPRVRATRAASFSSSCLCS